jgi:hypothetical protein
MTGYSETRKGIELLAAIQSKVRESKRRGTRQGRRRHREGV